ATEKRRQRQQLVAPRLSRLARHGAAGFRRDECEIASRLGCRATLKIESETEFSKKLQFETDDQRTGRGRILKMIDDCFERLENSLMRIALGKEPDQCGEMRDGVNRMRRREERSRAQVEPFDRVGAKMLVESRPPGRAHRISRLQDGPLARAEATAHQSEMAPVCARHHFEDRVRLPVPPYTQNNSLVGP